MSDTRSVGRWLQDQPDLDRLERELLVCEALSMSRAQLLARPETALAPTAERQLNDWAERLRRGEPLAYLTGRREFWGLCFEVSPDVLVPRPETELLLELALTRVESGARVLDLGTGSGAIAIALALHSDAQVTAVDLSRAALQLAARNGRRLGAAVHWLHSNWLAGVEGRYEMIVSNPPYVRAGDPHLAALRYEPQDALVAGADGLDALRCIVRDAPAHLTPDGWLLLEHGYDQGAAVRALLTPAGFVDVVSERDLAGHERVTLGRYRGVRG
ncbi:MAG: peptide chain release factor N(5)-glutamine methyltransferase [Pseudomonadales bacterium]